MLALICIVCATGVAEARGKQRAHAATPTVGPNWVVIDTSELTLATTPLPVIKGRLGTSSSDENCFVNPVLSIATRGLDQAVKNGDFTLKLRGKDSDRLAVFAFRAVVTDPGHEGERTTIVVVDEVRIDENLIIQSASGIFERLYQPVQFGKRLILRPRPRTEELVICPDTRAAPSQDTRRLASARFQHPSVWVTNVAPSSRRATVRSDSVFAITRGVSISRSPALAGAIQGVSADRPSEFQWKAAYSLSDDSWDRCVPAIGPSYRLSEFRCSEGITVHINPGSAAASRPRLGIVDWAKHIFGLSPTTRIRISSEPTDAAIFVGRERQGVRTLTRLTVPSERVNEIRIEKPGYRACTWAQATRSPGLGARAVTDIFCTLKRLSGETGRRRGARRHSR